MSLNLFPFFRLFFLVVMFFFFGVRPRDVRTQQEGGGRAAERGEPDVHPCGWFYLVPPRWWLGRRRNRGAKCVVSNSRPCPSWCALPKLTGWWWNCQSLEIDVVLNLMDWGWMIDGWPMMIHEVMVVDDGGGGGGYYIAFSEVGLIMFDFTLWSCSFWLLVLNVELHPGITQMMLDGSKSNSRWCSFYSKSPRVDRIILHVCIRLYQILISYDIMLMRLLVCQCCSNGRVARLMRVRQRSQRPADIVVDICQCFLRVEFDSYLIIRVDICYCNATVLSGIDWDFCDYSMLPQDADWRFRWRIGPCKKIWKALIASLWPGLMHKWNNGMNWSTGWHFALLFSGY